MSATLLLVSTLYIYNAERDSPPFWVSPKKLKP
jgi:hypothetical protein